MMQTLAARIAFDKLSLAYEASKYFKFIGMVFIIARNQKNVRKSTILL